MSKQLQLRGGTTSEHSTFTGAVREVTVDTDKDTLVVHDGSTAGGHPVLSAGGGTMTGALILNADPSVALGAATKQYVDTAESDANTYTDTAISNLVDSAPGALDTLNELAAALGDDANFSTTVTNSIATKLPLAGGTMTGAITFAAGQTFDGRDVSADGTKLDGIEANAKDDQTITAGTELSGGGTGDVTINHADVSRSDTTSSSTASHSGTQTVVDSVTTNARGHVTGINVKTITFPAGAIPNDGTLTMGTSGTGLSGSATFTADDSDNVTFTVTSNATNANTASTIVARDASGNFSAGTITAALSGNATTATTLQTARTIGGVSFDGSANINLPGVNTAGNQNTSGNAATASQVYINNDDTGDTNCPILFTLDTTAGNKAIYEDSSLYLDNTNNYVYGAQFIASSDRNLKDNITNVTDAVSKVQQLNGVTFNWKDSGDAEAGVIAQDVIEVLPEAVKENNNGHLSVNYGALHALLIEAIKEQQVQIEELKAKLGD